MAINHANSFILIGFIIWQYFTKHKNPIVHIKNSTFRADSILILLYSFKQSCAYVWDIFITTTMCTQCLKEPEEDVIVLGTEGPGSFKSPRVDAGNLTNALQEQEQQQDLLQI